MNYYNEYDKKAAAWLRGLIKAGLIPAGTVDERSIVDVQPEDLDGYTQCHFFAGIGGWSLALQLAGWPTARPVWTGSCPCQPFSSAGKGKGTDDERHLWPEFARLIGECKPATVFGEQVASKAGREWFDGVSTDLEDMGYAAAAADLCAAGAGAPHIRQRLFWVADAERGAAERQGHEVATATGGVSRAARQQRLRPDAGDGGADSGVADAQHDGSHTKEWVEAKPYENRPHDGLPERDGADDSGLGDTDGLRQPGQCGPEVGMGRADQAGESQPRQDGQWGDFSLVRCVEPTKEPGRFVEKRRRIEPGTVPLAHGIPGRVGLLRGYGNAIVPQVAAEFIQAYLEAN